MAHSSVGEVVKPSHEPFRRIPQRGKVELDERELPKCPGCSEVIFGYVSIYICIYIYIMIYIEYIELNMGTLQQTNTAMEYPRFGDHVVRESHGFP
jgi:hypothetical protein